MASTRKKSTPRPPSPSMPKAQSPAARKRIIDKVRDNAMGGSQANVPTQRRPLPDGHGPGGH